MPPWWRPFRRSAYLKGFMEGQRFLFTTGNIVLLYAHSNDAHLDGLRAATQGAFEWRVERATSDLRQLGISTFWTGIRIQENPVYKAWREW